MLTDEQVVALMCLGLYTHKIPVCSVNDVAKAVMHIIKADGATQVTKAELPKYWTSGYVDLHHIRNLYLISKHPRDSQLNGCERRMVHFFKKRAP